MPALVQIDRRIDPQKVVNLIMDGRQVDFSKISKDEATLQEEANAERQAMQGAAQMADAEAASASIANLSALTGVQ